MNSLLLVFLTLAASQNPSSPPEAVGTQAKVKGLDDRARRIAALTEELKEYERPVPKELKDVRQRVDKTMEVLKARARLLIELQLHFKEALRAKYELEAELDLYARWASAIAEEQAALKRRHEERVKELGRKKINLRHEANVVADLLRQKLEATLASYYATGGKEHLTTDLNLQIEDLKKGLKHLYLVPNQEEFRARHSELIDKQLQKKLDEMLAAIRDADFEANFVRTNVLGEFGEVSQRYLLLEQQEALQHAAELLKKARFMEDQAAQVATVSKYVCQWLQQMELQNGFVQKALELDRHLHLEPKIINAIEAVTAGIGPSGAVPRQLGGGLDLLLLPEQEPGAVPGGPKEGPKKEEK